MHQKEADRARENFGIDVPESDDQKLEAVGGSVDGVAARVGCWRQAPRIEIENPRGRELIRIGRQLVVESHHFYFQTGGTARA